MITTHCAQDKPFQMISLLYHVELFETTNSDRLHFITIKSCFYLTNCILYAISTSLFGCLHFRLVNMQLVLFVGSMNLMTIVTGLHGSHCWQHCACYLLHLNANKTCTSKNFNCILATNGFHCIDCVLRSFLLCLSLSVAPFAQ